MAWLSPFSTDPSGPTSQAVGLTQNPGTIYLGTTQEPTQGEACMADPKRQLKAWQKAN